MRFNISFKESSGKSFRLKSARLNSKAGSSLALDATRLISKSGSPNTQIYDKEGQEKYLEKNPVEILARNRLFKPPEMGGGTSQNGRRHLPKWEEAPPEMGGGTSRNGRRHCFKV